MAEVTDPNLMDPWGIALSAKSPFWISDQATGMATLYSVNNTTGVPSTVPLVVSVPNQGGAPPSPPPAEINGPTGQVSTGAPGITTAATDFIFSAAVRQGRLHLRQPGRLDLGVGRGGKPRRSRRPWRGRRSPGWGSATPRRSRRSTPPTRTAPTSTSSTASGR